MFREGVRVAEGVLKDMGFRQEGGKESVEKVKAA